MSTVALSRAKGWADALHDAEFKGRRDTDAAARYRLSRRLGIAESYLFRLQYRVSEMKDVAGEVYRRLGEAYEEMCLRNEQAAERYRAERLSRRSDNETAQEPDYSAHRMGPQ